MTPTDKLKQMLKTYPTARIRCHVRRTGWRELNDCRYYADANIIQLIFDDIRSENTDCYTCEPTGVTPKENVGISDA